MQRHLSDTGPSLHGKHVTVRDGCLSCGCVIGKNTEYNPNLERDSIENENVKSKKAWYKMIQRTRDDAELWNVNHQSNSR